jgi:hypothetical protein
MSPRYLLCQIEHSYFISAQRIATYFADMPREPVRRLRLHTGGSASSDVKRGPAMLTDLYWFFPKSPTVILGQCLQTMKVSPNMPDRLTFIILLYLIRNYNTKKPVRQLCYLLPLYVIGKPDGKRPFLKNMRRRKYNINTNITETGCRRLERIITGISKHGNEHSGFRRRWETSSLHD